MKFRGKRRRTLRQWWYNMFDLCDDLYLVIRVWGDKDLTSRCLMAVIKELTEDAYVDRVSSLP